MRAKRRCLESFISSTDEHTKLYQSGTLRACPLSIKRESLAHVTNPQLFVNATFIAA
jgi:hypothetical protein